MLYIWNACENQIVWGTPPSRHAATSKLFSRTLVHLAKGVGFAPTSSTLPDQLPTHTLHFSAGGIFHAGWASKNTITWCEKFCRTLGLKSTSARVQPCPGCHAAKRSEEQSQHDDLMLPALWTFETAAATSLLRQPLSRLQCAGLCGQTYLKHWLPQTWVFWLSRELLPSESCNQWQWPHEELCGIRSGSRYKPHGIADSARALALLPDV